MEVERSHTHIHTQSNKDNLTLIDIRPYQKTIFKIVWKWKNISVEQNGEFRYRHVCMCALIFDKISFQKQKTRII